MKWNVNLIISNTEMFAIKMKRIVNIIGHACKYVNCKVLFPVIGQYT